MNEIIQLLLDHPYHIGYMIFVGSYVAFDCVYFANSLLSKPFDFRKNILIFFGTSIFLGLWNIFGIFEIRIFVFGYYLAFTLFLICLYKQAWQNAIFYIILNFFALGYISRIMDWIYLSMGGSHYIINGIPCWRDSWIYLVSAAVHILLLFGLQFQLKKINPYQLKTNELFTILLFILPIAAFSYWITLTSVPLLSLPIDTLLFRTFMSICIVELMIVIIISRQQQTELVELRNLEQHLQGQYQRYLQKENSSAQILQKYHDLRKHLMFFQKAASENEFENYQTDLSTTLDTYDSVFETGNSSLDTILTEKYAECQALGITLACMADGSLLNFMDPIDIWTIFGNAVENAIESSRQLNQTEKKIIQVRIVQKDYLLIIRIENYFCHELRWKDGKLITSKTDPSNHGFGLKSIEYTVNKYHGNIRISTDDDKFTLTILIKL